MVHKLGIAQISSCVWTHVVPKETDECSHLIEPGIVCAAGAESDGHACHAEQSLYFKIWSTGCALRMTKPTAELGGKWEFAAHWLENGQTLEGQFDFMVYTLDEATNVLEDSNGETAVEISVGYNDRLELHARSYLARPRPQVRWKVNEWDMDNEAFSIEERSLGCVDCDGFLCNYESKLEFLISEALEINNFTISALFDQDYVHVDTKSVHVWINNADSIKAYSITMIIFVAILSRLV